MPDPNPNTVQIDRAQLDILNGSRALLARLLEDPDGGLALKRKVKKILPAANFPELDIVETVTKPYDAKLEAQGKTLADLKKEIDDDKQARADAKAEQTLRERLDAVKAQFSFTDEGMQAVVKRLKDQQSTDVEGAAAFVAGSQPKPKPTAGSGLFPSKMNLFGSGEVSEDPKIKRLNQDPMAFLEEEAIAVMDEFARGEAA